MCYSTQCWAHWRKYQKEFGVRIAIRDFALLYGYKRRAAAAGKKVYTPKGLDDSFRDPQTPEEAEIWAIVEELNKATAEAKQREFFEQRTRHVEAERKLQTKVTKKAQNDLRVSANKMKDARFKLDELARVEPKADDGRIFDMWWAPVMVLEAGELVVKPMRYHCRLDGWHAGMEGNYGTYNARRDSFATTWKKQFGYQHGIMLMNRFYENVKLHDYQQRDLRPGEPEENMVLEFRPRPDHDMLVACLWHHSKGFGDELPEFYSFAIITDEPPPEVAAAGHNRCPVPTKRENMMAWLAPDPARLDLLQAILDDRDRPFYEHEVEKRAA